LLAGTASITIEDPEHLLSRPFGVKWAQPVSEAASSVTRKRRLQRLV
jgi:hypothetical protein